MKRFLRGLFWFAGMLIMYGAYQLVRLLYGGPPTTAWPFRLAQPYGYAILGASWVLCLFLGVGAFIVGERWFKPASPPTDPAA